MMKNSNDDRIVDRDVVLLALDIAAREWEAGATPAETAGGSCTASNLAAECGLSRALAMRARREYARILAEV
jgi:hypothetical protein